MLRSLLVATLLSLAPAIASAAPVVGIDVSHHNGPVDWTKAKAAGVGFVYVKASEGVDDPDPAFRDHWRELARLNIPRGAYHFYVTEDDPKAQAKLFLSLTPARPGDLRPAIDIETLGRGSTADAPDKLATFIGIIEKAIGAKPVIYTSARFWNSEMAQHPRLLRAIEGCHLWVAEYEVASPRLPKGWTRWSMWQWQSDAPFAGIKGGVDHNRLHPGISLDMLVLPKKNKKGRKQMPRPI